MITVSTVVWDCVRSFSKEILDLTGTVPSKIVPSKDSVTLYYFGSEVDSAGGHTRRGRVVVYDEGAVLSFESDHPSEKRSKVWNFESDQDLKNLINMVQGVL